MTTHLVPPIFFAASTASLALVTAKPLETGSPYSQPIDGRGYRNRRSNNFDWNRFYGSEMNFNTLWGNGFAGHDLPPEPTQDYVPIYVPSKPETVPTTTSTTTTTMVYTTTSTESWRAETRFQTIISTIS